MNHWGEYIVKRDGSAMESGVVLSTLGQLRGLLVIPTRNNAYVLTINDASLSSFRNLVTGRGWVLEAFNGVDIPLNPLPNDQGQNPIRTNPNILGIPVQPAPVVSQRRRQRVSGADADAPPANVSLAKNLEMDIVNILLQKADGRLGELKNELGQLSIKYAIELDRLSAAVGGYHASRLIGPQIDILKANLLSEDAKKGRAEYFDAIEKMFGRSAAECEAIFGKTVTTVLGTITGSGLVTKADMDGKINSVIQMAADIETKKKVVDNFGNARRDKLLEETKQHIEAIKKLEFARGDVWLENGWLYVKTKCAFIPYGAHKYEFGEYRLGINILNTERSELNIEILNIRWPYNNKLHQFPHSYTNKRFCLGNAGQGLIKLYADWNWSLIFTLMWRMILSYNPSSPTRSIEMFVDEGKAIKRDKNYPEEPVVAAANDAVNF